jgi:hypothetical protein
LPKGGIPLFGKEGPGEISEEYVWSIMDSLVISSYQPILIGAGRFLALTGMGKADVVILEGDELIREKAVKIGIELLSSRSAKRMVVVLQRNPEDEQTFALPDYSLLLAKKLQSLGLQKDQFIIIGVPTNHPITLTL